LVPDDDELELMNFDDNNGEIDDDIMEEMKRLGADLPSDEEDDVDGMYDLEGIGDELKYDNEELGEEEGMSENEEIEEEEGEDEWNGIDDEEEENEEEELDDDDDDDEEEEEEEDDDDEEEEEEEEEEDTENNEINTSETQKDEVTPSTR